MHRIEAADDLDIVREQRTEPLEGVRVVIFSQYPHPRAVSDDSDFEGIVGVFLEDVVDGADEMIGGMDIPVIETHEDPAGIFKGGLGVGVMHFGVDKSAQKKKKNPNECKLFHAHLLSSITSALSPIRTTPERTIRQ